MAVFMINICKFNGCGITFQNLWDLIQHIEDNHIDYDPHVIQQKELQQPPCLPLSYVLRFFTDSNRKEKEANVKEVCDTKPKVKIVPAFNTRPTVTPLSASVTPNGSEADEDETVSDFEDSNDSWTTPEEFSSEYILRHGSKMIGSSPVGCESLGVDKPFACPVPGCKKRYKNVNGIKYHSKNGHKNDGRVRKGFKCHCGKSYKSSVGLKNHNLTAHSLTSAMSTLQTQGELMRPTSGGQVARLQPIRALTLKHIASLGLPLKTLVVTTKPSASAASSNDRTAKPLEQTLGVLTPAASPQLPSSSSSCVSLTSSSTSSVSSSLASSPSPSLHTPDNLQSPSRSSISSPTPSCTSLQIQPSSPSTSSPHSSDVNTAE